MRQQFNDIRDPQKDTSEKQNQPKWPKSVWLSLEIFRAKVQKLWLSASLFSLCLKYNLICTFIGGVCLWNRVKWKISYTEWPNFFDNIYVIHQICVKYLGRLGLFPSQLTAALFTLSTLSHSCFFICRLNIRTLCVIAKTWRPSWSQFMLLFSDSVETMSRVWQIAAVVCLALIYTICLVWCKRYYFNSSNFSISASCSNNRNCTKETKVDFLTTERVIRRRCPLSFWEIIL